MANPPGPLPFKTGDRLRIRHAGSEAEGYILLASPNGRSLMLSFDGRLGRYLQSMAVLNLGSGFTDLIDGLPVDVFRK